MRMTQSGKWVKPEAQKYLTCKFDLAYQFKQQMHDKPILGRAPLSVGIVFGIGGNYHHCDLDNQIKTILDAAKGIVFLDDRWVDHITAERSKTAEHVTTVFVQEL